MDESELPKLTIGELFDRQVQAFGDREFVAFPDRDVRFTYRTFRERVDMVARGIMATGVRKGEHIAIWAPNSPEWLLVQYAVAKIGAILVPINTTYAADELEYVLRHSESTTLFLAAGSGDINFLTELRTVLPEVDSSPVGHGRFENLPRLARFLFIGPQRQPGMLRFDDLFDLAIQTHPDDMQRRREALDSFEVIAVHYTAGSTGPPKGVMLTHRNVIVNAWRVGAALRMTHDDCVGVLAPLWSSAGANSASVGALLHGACIVPVATAEPRDALDAIARERCTVVFATPSQAERLAETADVASIDLSGLRCVAMLAAEIPADVPSSILLRGVQQVAVGYGLTEASPMVTIALADGARTLLHRAAGRPLPGVQVRVVDQVSGDGVAAGVEGELRVRGQGVMRGYHKDPHATVAATDSEGWLRTHDVGTIDRDGNVWIIGRLPAQGATAKAGSASTPHGQATHVPPRS